MNLLKVVVALLVLLPSLSSSEELVNEMVTKTGEKPAKEKVKVADERKAKEAFLTQLLINKELRCSKWPEC